MNQKFSYITKKSDLKLLNNNDESMHMPQMLQYNVDANKVKNTYSLYGEIVEEMGNFIIPKLYNNIIEESKNPNPTPIKFFITSPGGDLSVTLDIIALFKLAKKIKVPIHTYVLSYAASAASMIATCGHKRFITKNSYHLIHYARVQTYSDNPEMAERNSENIKFIQDTILNIYKENANIKQLTKEKKAKSFSELIKTDSYMLYSNELIKYKFADEYIC